MLFMQLAQHIILVISDHRQLINYTLTIKVSLLTLVNALGINLGIIALGYYKLITTFYRILKMYPK